MCSALRHNYNVTMPKTNSRQLPLQKSFYYKLPSIYDLPISNVATRETRHHTTGTQTTFATGDRNNKQICSAHIAMPSPTNSLIYITPFNITPLNTANTKQLDSYSKLLFTSICCSVVNQLVHFP